MRPEDETGARWSSRYLLAAVGLLVAALAGVVGPLPLEARFVGAYLLHVVLPGWLLTTVALGGARGPGLLERCLLALGAGYGIAMLVGLVIYALVRPAATWHLTAGALVVNLTLLALAGLWRATGHEAKRPLPSSLARAPWAAPLLILVLGGGLRLADLGWSEFQGDEARILLRAIAALQGLPDALEAHRKVPGEVLLAYVFYGQLGAVTEAVGRLPFVLAGVAGLLAFYELARQLFDRRVALLAALLLAVDGYSVAFGRILQYDSLAFLLGTLGLLCCRRLGRSERPEAGLALLGSLCLFGAVLVALGAIFFLPPAAVLLAPRLRAGRRPGWRTLAAAGWPVAPGLLAAALVLRGAEPTVAGPTGVASYLEQRLGDDAPYLNLSLFLRSANHYLSTVYLATVLGGALVALGLALGRALRAHRLGSATLVVGLLALGFGLAFDRSRVALVLVSGAVVLLLATARHASPGWRLALLWAAGPLLVHLFLVRQPGTHWREAFPGFILLFAALAAAGLGRLPPGWPRYLPIGALALLIGGSGHYAWVSLVQRWPEYQVSFPDGRHPFDLTRSDGRGIGGVFGVAHRHGWKALAQADARGAFRGSYATNESPAIAAWYVRRPQGCPEPPNVGFRVPRAPQDRNLTGPVPIPPEYATVGRVLVDGRPTILIVAPPGGRPIGGLPLTPEAGEFFDRERTSPWLAIGQLYRPDLGAATARRDCGR